MKKKKKRKGLIAAIRGYRKKLKRANQRLGISEKRFDRIMVSDQKIKQAIKGAEKNINEIKQKFRETSLQQKFEEGILQAEDLKALRNAEFLAGQVAQQRRADIAQIDKIVRIAKKMPWGVLGVKAWIRAAEKNKSVFESEAKKADELLKNIRKLRQMIEEEGP